MSKSKARSGRGAVTKNAALDRAIGHFEDLPIRRHEVPEWGAEGEPLVFYSKPLNMKEIAELSAKGADNVARNVDIIIMKAEDDQGKKIFDRTARLDLMDRVDPKIIGRLADEIVETLSVETQVGN